MEPQAVHEIDDPRVSIYRDLSDNRRLREQGCFLVEGRANIACLVVRSRFEVRSVLVTPTAFEGLREILGKLDDRVPVFAATPEVLSGIAGYNIHRGALALGEVPPEISPTRLIAPSGEPSLIVALEHLTDPDNVGSTFRSAMAFGVDGVLLDSRCCDPLYRKAIRVSMGGTLCLPFAREKAWPQGLTSFRDAGYRIAGLHPDPLESGAVDLSDLDAHWDLGNRVVLVLGNEGAGLSMDLRGFSDRCVRIAMMPGIDSLNVASAAAIALYEFSKHCRRGSQA